ncbi:hypothetical protein J3Q64DRAFT_1706507 [Phycomyces blakesleeanus]|uniref:Uncharacterized protein n=1 Tax=Phycomyces blakesleeanus TaxID=4837 RepID=A0ABR3BBS4_PHYBL
MDLIYLFIIYVQRSLFLTFNTLLFERTITKIHSFSHFFYLSDYFFVVVWFGLVWLRRSVCCINSSTDIHQQSILLLKECVYCL